MNGIQKYLHEKMIEAMYQSAGELIANTKSKKDVAINTNEISQSLIEFEKAMNSKFKDFQSDVKTKVDYLSFEGSSSFFVDKV